MADKIHFQPVLVSGSKKLSTVKIKNGQYIIVTDTNEVYVDMDNVRKRTSTKAFVQSTAPDNPIEGDIWLVTKEE